MRYNVLAYLIGDGFKNVFKNKKSTSASLIIMCLTMIVFGLFFIIGENVSHIMNEIESAQGMQVFIKRGTTEEQITKLGEEIKTLSGVNTVEFVSKEAALNQMKEKFAEKAYLLEPYEKNNIFSESYVVTLTNLELNSQVQDQILKLDNVKKITSRDKTISALISIANGVRIVTFAILVFLIIISVSIISNTIKLTVHARRKEISIMKYVGATNGFIRWPFMVEGMIIGIMAGAISILIVGLTYNFAVEKMISSEFMQIINVSLVSFADMFNLIVIIYLLLGIGIGVIGSSISMRKYLNV